MLTLHLGSADGIVGTLTCGATSGFPGRLLAHSGFRRFHAKWPVGLFVQYQQADATVDGIIRSASLKRIVAAMPTTRNTLPPFTRQPSVRGGMHWHDRQKAPSAVTFLTAGVGKIIGMTREANRLGIPFSTGAMARRMSRI